MFTTVRDLKREVCERLGLDEITEEMVRQAAHREGRRYEQIDGPALDRILRDVWAQATDNARWPFDE